MIKKGYDTMNSRQILTATLIASSLPYALAEAMETENHPELEEVLTLPIQTHQDYVLLAGDVSSLISQLPADAYTGEPLTTDKYEKGEFNLENLEQFFGSPKRSLVSGLSVLVAQKNKEGDPTIVGFRLAEDLTDFFEKIDLTTKDMDYIGKFTKQAIQKYIETFDLPKGLLTELTDQPGELMPESKELIKGQKIVHFGGLAISPAHRKKGLSYVLVNRAIELARKAGYNQIVVETTGNASYQIMMNSGFKVIDEYLYKTPINGHDAYRVLILSLTD